MRHKASATQISTFCYYFNQSQNIRPVEIKKTGWLVKIEIVVMVEISNAQASQQTVSLLEVLSSSFDIQIIDLNM